VAARGTALAVADRFHAAEQRIPFASLAGVGPRWAQAPGPRRGVWQSGAPLGEAAKAILPGMRTMARGSVPPAPERSPAAAGRIPFACLAAADDRPVSGWNRAVAGGSRAPGGRLVKKEGGLTRAGADAHPCAFL